MNADFAVAVGEALDRVRTRVREVIHHRGWPEDWRSRLAYHLLEVSELTEAVRGKRESGSIQLEAGDALNTLLAMIPDDVPLEDVLMASLSKLEDLMTRPRYEGEDFTGGFVE